MQVSGNIDIAYDNYIRYRFGENFKQKLLVDDSFKDIEYAKQWYITELIKLSQNFTELSNVILDKETGEIFDTIKDTKNPIEEQWDTYSVTYRQDLDILTKTLGVEPIEYERL